MNHFASEFGEDQVLWNKFPEFFSRPQFYLDIGAAHPIHGSNTFWLRNLGWSGLNIDADPDWKQYWPEGALIQAIIHTEPRVHFTENPVHVLSRVEPGEDNAQAVRLDDLLKARGVDGIGFLSIDVEGQELRVLESMEGHAKWPPFIVSEFNTAGIGEDFSVMNYLMPRGYTPIHQTVANIIYYDESRRTD